MAVGSKASQWHEMFCHDPEVMGLNPSQVEVGSAYYFCQSLSIITNLTVLLRLCLITHESVLTGGFGFTAGLVCNKTVGSNKLVSDSLSFTVIKQGLTICWLEFGFVMLPLLVELPLAHCFAQHPSCTSLILTLCWATAQASANNNNTSQELLK